MAFVPHQTIPGVSPEAAQALLEIQRQIGQDLDDLRRGPVVTSLQREDYGARENEYVRCAPPAGGMTILLPPSRPQNQGKNIRVLVETVLSGGGVTISVARGTINGLVIITLTTVGLVEFTSDGLGNWLSAWAPGTTGTPPGVAGTMLATQSPPGQPGETRRPPVIPGPRGLTGKSAPPAPPGLPGPVGWRGSIVPGVLPIIPRGNAIGVPIDSDNDNEQARALTPFELGRMVRFSRQFSDTASTGTVTAYSLPDPYTGVTFNTPADLILRGLSSGKFNAGRVFFFCIDITATFSVTLKHNNGSASAATRFFNPTLSDLVLSAGDAVLIFHDPIQDRYIPMLISPRGRLLKVTHYSGTSGTHSFQAGTRYYEVEIQAAGGGGGGANSDALQCAVGASGGLGARARYGFTTVPVSEPFDCGAAGAAGANTGADGGDATDATWSTGATTITVGSGKGGEGSANATRGSGSSLVFAMTGPGGIGGQAVIGTPPTGGTLLSFSHGAAGLPGVVLSGTAGWGGGCVIVEPTAGSGLGALSTNNSDNAGNTGDVGRVTVWEYS